jgi:hypothetical protein
LVVMADRIYVTLGPTLPPKEGVQIAIRLVAAAPA